MDDSGTQPATRSITSEGLAPGAVRACWGVAAILMGSGITATFVAGTGAAPAAMILFGSLFLILGLMKRVPLSLEVGGAKFDASYIANKAFDAGHDGGVQKGVEDAIHEVEEAEERGESPDAALERLRHRVTWDLTSAVADPWRQQAPLGTVGYEGPTACLTAGISYRQLDFWDRTHVVVPSVKGAGNRRLYSARDIVRLKVMKRLLDAGVSMQQVRFAAERLRDVPDERLSKITLMSDGQSIYETTSNEEVIGLLQAGRGTFGISLGTVVREVEEALRELPPGEPDGDEPLPTLA